MTNPREIAVLVSVGALWGCTNPLLRKGALETPTGLKSSSNDVHLQGAAGKTAATDLGLAAQRIARSLSRFREVKVWLPYVVNQLGSVLFYVSLSQSEMSLVVPICNALALVFSVITSHALGERVDQPVRIFLGAALVMAGVSLCLLSRSSGDQP